MSFVLTPLKLASKLPLTPSHSLPGPGLFSMRWCGELSLRKERLFRMHAPAEALPLLCGVNVGQLLLGLKPLDS